MHDDGGGIIMGGQVIACDAPVIWPVVSGLAFPDHKRDRKLTRVVQLHWTGAENPPAAVVRNMTRARSSVHFIVTHEGEIYQTLDAARRGAHCKGGGANDFAVGIEFQNRGHRLKLPDKGVARELVDDVVHGEKIRYGAMTDAQVAAAIALCRALCRAYRLPMVVPIDAQTGSVYAKVLPDNYGKRYRGIAGHYHYEPGKPDPGTHFLQRVGAALDPTPGGAREMLT